MSLDTLAVQSPLAGLRPSEAAVFLQLDGALIEPAANSDTVEIPPETLALLAVLESETGGAFAMATGRDLVGIRRHLPIVPHAVIASDGAERVLPGASAYRHPVIDAAQVAEIHSRAARATALDGVVVERNASGAVIDFRTCPEHQEAVRELSLAILAKYEGLEMVLAEHSVAIQPEGIGMDRAVAATMATKLFAGRIPIYIGADASDEAPLAWVADQGGLAIKVGPGDTAAPYRLESATAVLGALAKWLEDGWMDA